MSPDLNLQDFGVLPNNRQSGRLELQLRCLVRLYRAVVLELKSRTGLPWRQRWKAWSLGFSSHSWMVLNLPEKNPDLYVNDLRTAFRQYHINGFFNPIIGNKLVLPRLLEAQGLPHPRVISIILNGQLIEQGAPFSPDTAQTLARTLERCPHQVYRPTWSGSGQGVFFLKKDKGALLLNGKPVSESEACALLEGLDRYLVTEFIQQADYARTIYPHTTNTLRILSLWDIQRGEPFIAAACQRLGSSRTGMLDNFLGGLGGISASVDLESATLGPAASKTSGNGMDWLSHHPDSGEQIEGVEIPGFQACLKSVLRAAGSFPFCPLIGWDIVMTRNGFSIVEANSMPAFTVTQVHTPLLADPRSRAFFQHWGMAPKKRPRP